MTSTKPKILLTGATGYIGGSILTQLINSPSPILKDATITCLLRGPDRAATLSSTYGLRVRTTLYRDLDDLETTTAAAAQHDIVISTTFGYHSTSAKALIDGLSQRKAETGRDVWMIHTSGSSNLGDAPITGAFLESREFDDAKDDIYGYEKARQEAVDYPQRGTELGVVDSGLELGVKTLVIMSPTIYGLGTGLFNKISIQIPAYIRSVLDLGRAIVLGDGKGVWDHVHVQDLAELYEIALLNILEKEGKGLPTGKKGIIFSGNGRHSWMDVSQEVANVCYDGGKIASTQVESVGLAEQAQLLAKYVGFLSDEQMELAFASNSRTVSTVARQLGWKPTKGEEAWKDGFRDDVAVVLNERKGT